MDSRKPYTVLVIDDEESMRDSCSLILAKEGFEADTAENGELGLEKVREKLPDFVLIDLKMPGIGGLEVLDKVKKINPDSIPIVITGYATVESAVEAMKRGAYDFLPKPFTPEELRLIIRRGVERKKLQEEADSLRREKKLIEENFITMVSHQLRSPLVAVAQYFEVVLGGHLGDIGPQLKEMIEKARARLEGLLNLINDWLSIARMNGGQLVDRLKPTHLEPMLAKLVDFLQALTEENNITLRLAPPSGSDLALADPETLEEVFSNLITNAIKYNTIDGSVTLSIREESKTIVVDVADTGVGISQEHLPFIFDQFYQIDRSKRGADKGSGLGLAIAKRIVEAHGGSLHVTSRAGEGSTFSVSLPKPGAASPPQT
jgi:two-component system sensor histidine kinase/response regulator